MTKSQNTAVIATICTVISAISGATLPHLQLLPEPYNVIATVVSILGAAAGAVLIAINQSLSPAHVSIPKKKAKKVIKENPEVAKELGLKEELPSLNETTHTKKKGGK